MKARLQQEVREARTARVRYAVTSARAGGELAGRLDLAAGGPAAGERKHAPARLQRHCSQTRPRNKRAAVETLEYGGCERRAEQSVPPMLRFAVPAAQCAWRVMPPATTACSTAQRTRQRTTAAAPESARGRGQHVRAVTPAWARTAFPGGCVSCSGPCGALRGGCAASAIETGRACARVARPAAGPERPATACRRAPVTRRCLHLCARALVGVSASVLADASVMSRCRGGTLDRHNGRPVPRSAAAPVPRAIAQNLARA